jgi:hypothetical protein
MEAGTVFKWNNFPDPKYGDEIKPRWLVYLGETTSLRPPVYALLCTSTTQTDALEPGGIKYNHSICKYHPNSSPFEKECFVDVDEGSYDIEKSRLTNNVDIEIMGRLDEQQMRELYNKILRSPYYSKMKVLDIHRGFNNAGVTSLKIPK